MPRSVRTVQTPGLAGAAPTFSAADNTNGESFVWAGVPVLVEVKNTGGGACTVTLNANATTKLGGMALANKTYNVPATTGDVQFAVADPAGVLQSDGSIYLDYSTGTGVTVQVLRVQ